MLDKLLGNKETDTERQLRELRQQRKWEREVFETAMREWLLHSGLAPVMIEQTREKFGDLEGIEQWPPEQHEHYMTVDFDPRREDHNEIKRFVEGDDE